MKFNLLLEIVGEEHVFRSRFSSSRERGPRGQAPTFPLGRSRPAGPVWARALCSGVALPADPAASFPCCKQVRPGLVRQSAIGLVHYTLIPEYVSVTTSVPRGPFLPAENPPGRLRISQYP